MRLRTCGSPALGWDVGGVIPDCQKPSAGAALQQQNCPLSWEVTTLAGDETDTAEAVFPVQTFPSNSYSASYTEFIYLP